MDLRSTYDIPRTAEFILGGGGGGGGFSRVGLQFPDEMLKDSIRVAGLLRAELGSRGRDDVALFVMADTTFGSCCVDEVGASHVDADCVVHYGHTCLSPTSTLPAFFVFGKAVINVDDCVKCLSDSLSATPKPALILFGLEYAYAIEEVKSAIVQQVPSLSNSEVHFAEVKASVIKPANNCEEQDAKSSLSDDFDADESQSPNAYDHGNSKSGKIRSYNLGGLIWKLPLDCEMTDHLLFWIGSDNSAFANLVLTYGDCEIVRYDPNENSIEKDISQKKRILKRRYYLVERAKDASIVGILVGTLGVAGYLNMIYQMKDLIVGAGKKAYLFVMGRPNPAKLANFPECDVFIYVSCAQTALLDSKEFLAPVITPFEAMLAFKRGSQWTGAYVMEFRDLISSSALQLGGNAEATRFSFFEGGYVEDFEIEDREEEHNRGLALAKATKEALTITERCTSSGLVKGKAKSVTEFFASRTYHGLEVANETSQTQSVLIGRTGRASGYDHETGGTEKT